MSWTYSGDPSTTEMDWVRFRIGDTIEEDQQLSNEEILALITEYGNKITAASQAAKRIAAWYARRVDVGDDRSESLSQRQAHYKALADEIAIEAGQRNPNGGIRITGASLGRRNAVRDNADRVQPIAHRGQWSRNDDSGTPP